MAYESEWLTRKRRIDGRLKAAGWEIVPFSQEMLSHSLDNVALEELPTANGPADYGLFVAGRSLGIVEAKKVGVNDTLPPDIVLHLDRKTFLLQSPATAGVEHMAKTTTATARPGIKEED
jgi:type I restriction enzyme R subunit